MLPSLQVFRLQFVTHLIYLPKPPHVPLTSSPLIWFPQYLPKNTNYETVFMLFSLYFLSHDPIIVHTFVTVLTYQFLNITINRNNSVKRLITNWATGLRFPIAAGIFFFITTPRSFLDPTLFAVQRVPWLFLGVKANEAWSWLIICL